MFEREFRLPLAGLILLVGATAGMLAPGPGAATLVMLVAAVMMAAVMMAAGAPAATPASGPALPAGPATLFDNADFLALIDQDERPMIALAGERVRLANAAARQVLGSHIIGADVRTAIRHPAALGQIARLAAGDTPGEDVDLFDLQRTGDRWTMRLARLSQGQWLILLDDRSALDAAERMRSDFVANASHELRTPLAAILGYVETLRHLDPADGDAVRERFLAIIDREAGRMQQLVADLLSVSRIEADRYRRPTDPVDLAAVLKSVVADLQESGGARASDIVIDRADPGTLAGDRAQLVQMVHNILTNAMKYGRPGSPITARVQARLGNLRLSVADQGDGIAADHLPRLTERFYRVDNARSRQVGGTGLGLAIVKHIAERHRARLHISSEAGVGTRVTLHFPAIGGSAAGGSASMAD